MCVVRKPHGWKCLQRQLLIMRLQVLQNNLWNFVVKIKLSSRCLSEKLPKILAVLWLKQLKYFFNEVIVRK